MASRVKTGPKGGKYVEKGGKKVYLKGKKRTMGMASRMASRRTGGPIRGRGGYWQDFKNWSSKNLQPFARGGAALGNALGGASGGEVGGKIGAWLGKLTGVGDYKVAKNTLLGVTTGGTNGGPPRIENLGGRTIINHREYIADVFGTTDFVVNSYPINPGVSTTFPWLSDLANCYQEWRPLGIIVCFESTSANALDSTNTALGSVIIASNYNASDPVYASEREMLNTEFHSATKPSKHVLHPLECDEKKSPLGVFYIRNGAAGPPENANLWYDLANVQVATVGMQASANIGKLYISYEIELMKSTLNGLSSGKPLKLAHYTIPPTGIATGAPMGTLPPVQVQDNIGLTFSDGISINFPPGMANAAFLGSMTWTGATTAACASDGLIGSGGMAMLNYFEGQAEPITPNAFPVTTSQFQLNFACECDPLGLGGAINFGTTGNVFPGALAATSELIITQIRPPDIQEEKSGTSTVNTMSDYERELRKFIADPKNASLPVEARFALFDRLHGSAEGEPEEKKTTGGPVVYADDYIDLSAQMKRATISKKSKAT